MTASSTTQPHALLDELRTVGSGLPGLSSDVPPFQMWADRRLHYRMVGPLNRRKFTVVVVGTGLAGAGAAAALGELGYTVESFTFHDAPRRAHSVAAQGGINAARARTVDNDSIARFVKDTVKGGDFRGREADAWRLAEESIRVIDHMNAIGAPFAREYGAGWPPARSAAYRSPGPTTRAGRPVSSCRLPPPRRCCGRSPRDR